MGGTPKSFTLIGFSIQNHPAMGDHHLWKPPFVMSDLAGNENQPPRLVILQEIQVIHLHSRARVSEKIIFRRS